MTIVHDQIINDLNTNTTVARNHIRSAKAFIEQAEAVGNEAAKKLATTALDLAVGAKKMSRAALCALPGSPDQLTYQKQGLKYLKSAEHRETAALLG